jgi:hypothetical protein
MSNLKTLISRALSHTPLQYFPVRVRKGLAQGAHWTLFPYSANWRGQVEQDVEMAVRRYGTMTGAACWDLGTHFGIYTVGMAMAVGSAGQVAGSAWEVEGVIELLRPLKYQPYTCEGSRSDWPASSFCQTLVLQR